ncbi:ictacalcin-like [Corythoichthys intestinalis]|uniref:ictacalcin-like n=1 Tax=Corythoichthys intestinalis TaxID=161448 RepID=UPI0025A559DE|nr:ictacalcin-like [Corythoichthys intestinalis]XP_057684282.1 ictacalcin-like [Corythoichthys intestinalis]XP_057684283.1 ictacalcin-like [Corythoichthys intestinalis]XP_061808749.1 ictacalcin-like [Nerophis lumbriciformis]
MGVVEEAMTSLIVAFHEYAGKEGDKDSMNKREVKEMLTKEFGLKLEKAKDQTAIDRIFKDLDVNSDNKVDFQEFMILVTGLTVLLHECQEEH